MSKYWNKFLSFLSKLLNVMEEWWMNELHVVYVFQFFHSSVFPIWKKSQLLQKSRYKISLLSQLKKCLFYQVSTINVGSINAYLVLTPKMFYMYLFEIIVIFFILDKLENWNSAHENINQMKFILITGSVKNVWNI